MKKGDTVTMLFHMIGLTSEEEHNVLKVKGDEVTLDTDDDPKKCFRFSLKTGRCLNDVTDFGASRTIKLP